MGLHPNLRLPELEGEFRVHLYGGVWEQVQLLSHTRVLVGKRENEQAHLCSAGFEPCPWPGAHLGAGLQGEDPGESLPCF